MRSIRRLQLIALGVVVAVFALLLGRPFVEPSASATSYGSPPQITRVQNNGTVMTAEPTLNIVGATSITDDSANNRTTITIPANLPPSGAAGGALAGTYPNPTMAPAAAGNGLTVTAGQVVALSDATGGANLAKAINVSGNGLAVKVDASTITANGSNQLLVPAQGITATQIATSVAGNGLTGGNGTALAVLANGATLGVSASGVLIAQQGASAGQVLTWGGASWLPTSVTSLLVFGFGTNATGNVFVAPGFEAASSATVEYQINQPRSSFVVSINVRAQTGPGVGHTDTVTWRLNGVDQYSATIAGAGAQSGSATGIVNVGIGGLISVKYAFSAGSTAANVIVSLEVL